LEGQNDLAYCTNVKVNLYNMVCPVQKECHGAETLAPANINSNDTFDIELSVMFVGPKSLKIVAILNTTLILIITLLNMVSLLFMRLLLTGFTHS